MRLFEVILSKKYECTAKTIIFTVSVNPKCMMHKLKVLFVCSGNNPTGKSPNVEIQASGLMHAGVNVHFFEIKKKGFSGYIHYAFKLRSFLKKNSFDVIHAHYGLSGMLASLAGANPLVVTIMGSELYLNNAIRKATVFFVRHVWKYTIVQSEKMKKTAGRADVIVLPNGVDIEKFRAIDVSEAKKRTGFTHGKHVIWVARPDRPEKNVALAKEAIGLLQDDGFVLDIIFDKTYDEIPYFFRAADVLLLTSKWEGSPNVIKEALAARLPVVSNDVGNVKEMLSGIKGCFVTGDDAESLSGALREAVKYKDKVDGDKVLRGLGMDTVSNKLKEIYDSVRLK